MSESIDRIAAAAKASAATIERNLAETKAMLDRKPCDCGRCWDCLAAEEALRDIARRY